jgi:hypothetical protein
VSNSYTIGLSSCPTSGWRNFGDVLIENGEFLNDFAGDIRLSPSAGILDL